jgi:hypothetical protein
MYLAPASGSLVQLASEGRIALRSSGDTNSDAEIEEIRSSSWDATKKRIQNIELSPGSDFFLVVSNLDLNGGYFLLEVRDRQDVLVGQALLEVDPSQSRWRNLRDLFRGLDARPRPFRLEVQSSGPRFTAFGILVDPIGGGVFAYPGTP